MQIEILLENSPNQKEKVHGLLDAKFRKALQDLVNELDGKHEDSDNSDSAGSSIDSGPTQRRRRPVAAGTGNRKRVEPRPTMGGDNFDVIVAYDGGDICEIDNALADLVRKYGYAYQKVDQGPYWVTWQFTGTVKEGELFPRDYMWLNDYLVSQRFTRAGSYWGERRFEKTVETGNSSLKESLHFAPELPASDVKPEEKPTAKLNDAAGTKPRQKRPKNGPDSSASTTRKRQTIEDDLTDAQKKKFTEKTRTECNRENIVKAVETKLPRSLDYSFDASWGAKELYQVWTEEDAYKPRTRQRITPSQEEIDTKFKELERPTNIAHIRNPLQKIEGQLDLPVGISSWSPNRADLLKRLKPLIPSLLRREMDDKHAKPSSHGIINAGI